MRKLEDIMASFQQLQKLSDRISDPLQFWKLVLNKAKHNNTPGSLSQIENLNILEESNKLIVKITNNLKNDLIPFSIKSIYFGLFEQIINKKNISQGFYISGSERNYDKKGEFLSNLDWLPKWRYFKVEVLDTILKASKGCNASKGKPPKEESITFVWNKNGELCKLTENMRKIKLTESEKAKWLNLEIVSENEEDLFSYFLTLGAAISLVKSIKSKCNFGKRKIFVGFDSGDFLEVK